MARKLLFENSKSRISLVDSITYCDVLSEDIAAAIPKQIVMKVLKNNIPGPDEIQQFYNEYEILKDITHPNIRKVYTKTKYQNRHTIFLEWIDGKPLKNLGKIKNIERFLTIAIQIASALMEVHSHHIVHNDVNAKNILVNPTTNDVKLIDFGIASDETTERMKNRCSCFEGTVSYASPEQLLSGRHNTTTTTNNETTMVVVVDHRSDLYSLGVVFYLMTTGKLPFESSSIEGLKKMHYNDRATSIRDVDPTIPHPLSALIEKLMSKDPNDRYQSDYGLLYDLRHMLGSLVVGGTVPSDFVIAQCDFSGRLQTTTTTTTLHKIYGRAKETATISSAFNRVAAAVVEGAAAAASSSSSSLFEVCMITGAAGTGKSSLVNSQSVQNVVRRKGGYFVNGKFDRLQKDEPYSAILRAFDAFCGSLVAREDSDVIEKLGHRITDALGAEGKKLLADTMPQLRCLIGDDDRPDVIPADIDSVVEIKNRWCNVFLKFINAITSEKRPILLFIDDLQWADDESLSLLLALAADNDVKYLLFVGAYRRDEMSDKNHSLLSTIGNSTSNGNNNNNVKVHMIEIGNLSNDDTAKLVYSLLDASAASCDDDDDDISSLANLVYLKTHGNAFFIIECMKSFINDKLLYFCYSELKWKYNMQEISAKNVTENVVEFLLERLMKYSNETKHVLKMASCLGSRFTLSMLRLLVKDDNLPMIINKAVFEGIITLVSSSSPENDSATFCFSHDKIHQAVYLLDLESSERNSSTTQHLHIGRVLKEKLSTSELNEMLFVVVNQLNSGLDMIDDECERADVAHLNLRAAKKARFSSAFKKAAMYVGFGISLLSDDDDHWMTQYELSLELYTVAVGLEYCNGDFDRMMNLMEELFSNTRTTYDAVDSYTVKINYLTGQKKYNEAIQIGIHVLTELGEPMSINPSAISVMYNYFKTKIKMWGRDASDAIVSMNCITDEKERSKMKLLSAVLVPAVMNDDFVKVQVMLRMVQITLSHGLSEFSAVAFAKYGALVAIFNDINEGYRFGQVALQLLNRFPSKVSCIHTYPVVFGGINHKKEHIKDIIPNLQQSSQIAHDIGDFGMSVLTFYLACVYSFLSGGKSLEEVEHGFKICHDNAHTHKIEHVEIIVKPIWQGIRNLLDGSKSWKKTNLFGDIFTECDVQTYSKEPPFIFAYHLANLLHTYLFHDYDQAAQIASDGGKEFRLYLWYGKTTITFYHGLIALIKARDDPNNNNGDKKKWMKIATNSIQTMEKLTEHCPDNHQHKLQLLYAESAIVEKRCGQKAIEHFDEAINFAERKGFLNIEALASERALIFCMEQCDLNSALVYYSRACQVYREWGAHAKVSQIEEMYGRQMSSFSKVTLKRKMGG